MKPVEIEVKIACARREMEHWQNILAQKSCRNCVNFHHPGCRLAGGIMPPPEVVKVGCPEWAFDCIPF